MALFGSGTSQIDCAKATFAEFLDDLVFVKVIISVLVLVQTAHMGVPEVKTGPAEGCG